MLLVTDSAGARQGMVTKTDILRAVRMASDSAGYRKLKITSRTSEAR
jgi:hypothetical protein